MIELLTLSSQTQKPLGQGLALTIPGSMGRHHTDSIGPAQRMSLGKTEQLTPTAILKRRAG